MKTNRFLPGILVLIILCFNACVKDDVTITPAEPDTQSTDQEQQNNDDDDASSNIVYEVGDTGPAGGIIILDRGEGAADWRYLELGPEDIGLGDQFGCLFQEIADARNPDIGAGLDNSMAILAAHDGLDDYYNNPQQCANSNDGTVAAKTCLEYELNGFDDWFLPSQEELLLAHAAYYEIGLGQFELERLYWTSTEATTDGAIMVDFGTSPEEGHFGIGGKSFGDIISVVRPVRYVMD